MRLVLVGLVLASGCGSVGSVADAELSADGPPVDAAVAAPFDIAYISAMRLVNTTVGTPQMALVVNTGTAPLAMPELAIVSVTDDDPAIIFEFYYFDEPAPFDLPPGQAAGVLSTGSAVWVDPLVSEPRYDTTTPTLAFSLYNIPPATDKVVHASARLRSGSDEAVLDFTFTLESTGTSAAFIQDAVRVSSAPF